MRILIVEDDRETAASLKANLEAKRYSVDVEYDGDKASYRARTNEYDLILLDNVLPGKQGPDICRELREYKMNVLVLVLSAQSEVDRKVGLLNCGADDYITKPYSFDELAARVNALLRRPGSFESDKLSADDLSLDRGVPRPLPFSKTYDPLGSRSIGHALPAIAILLRTGFVDTAQTASLKNFFLDYLTARQLHDDARDWEDDLKRGSINGVSNELLRISGLEIFSRESLPVLRKIFERKVKKWSVAHINSRINRSRKNLHKITAFKNTEPLERMFKRLEI